MTHSKILKNAKRLKHKNKCTKLLGVLLVAGCGTSNYPVGPSMSDEFEIPQNQIESMIVAANSGDADKAYLLHLHYSLHEWNPDRSSYWLNKAAEDGHFQAKEAIANLSAENLSDNGKAN